MQVEDTEVIGFDPAVIYLGGRAQVEHAAHTEGGEFIKFHGQFRATNAEDGVITDAPFAKSIGSNGRLKTNTYSFLFGSVT